MPKIEEMYAYIAHEKDDPDDEGLTAFRESSSMEWDFIG